MKTITEFSGLAIRRAAQTLARLQSEGVEGEQRTEQLGSALGMEGDRLSRLMEALEAAGGAVETLRLVRVFAGDQEVKGAKKIGDFNYLLDAMPASAKARDGDGRGHDRRGGRKGGRDQRGDGGGRGGGRPRTQEGRSGEGVGEREDRGGPMATSGPGWVLTRAPREDQRDRRNRGPSGPRGARRGGPPKPGAPGAQEQRPGMPRTGDAGAAGAGDAGRARRGPPPPGGGGREQRGRSGGRGGQGQGQRGQGRGPGQGQGQGQRGATPAPLPKSPAGASAARPADASSSPQQPSAESKP